MNKLHKIINKCIALYTPAWVVDGFGHGVHQYYGELHIHWLSEYGGDIAYVCIKGVDDTFMDHDIPAEALQKIRAAKERWMNDRRRARYASNEKAFDNVLDDLERYRQSHKL